jgi:Zn-dependent protease
MNLDPQALFPAFITVAAMLLVGFPIHEALHAWTAMKLGDNTARWMGRVSLDPRVHFDPIGGVILAVTAFLSATSLGGLLFGWAKPTPVNPLNLQYGRRGHALVAFAGPASNLVIAIIVAVPMRIVLSSRDLSTMVIQSSLLDMFWNVGSLLLTLNIVLFIFNLIPIPPLDGWSVLKGLLPAYSARRLEQLEVQYANVIPTLFLGFVFLLFFAGSRILAPIVNGIASFLVGA